MKRNKFYWRFLAVLWCCISTSLISTGQVQNTYSLGIDHDHYSIVESQSNPDNVVMAGTLYRSGSDNDIHVLEVDALGNIVWEYFYGSTADDRAFHIGAAPSGYIIAGLNDQGGSPEALLMTLDFAGVIIDQKNYPDTQFGIGSRALHATAGLNDPNGGFALAGWMGGDTDTSPKSAWIAKVDNSLNLVWSRLYDSPAGGNDFDMGSHVLEVPNRGYFLTGSCNRVTGEQHILGAMVDLLGNPSWTNEYSDNPSGGHYSVGASAFYCASKNQIYQLSNLSIVHHFGVNVFDATTGVRDVPKSWRIFSQFGYVNIQGFKIMEAMNPDHMIIAGYMRDHFWQETDPEGNQTGNTLTGSVPFMMEILKDPTLSPTPILWDKLYEIPSPGYTTTTDIYDAFSAGQQPRINHPEMAINRNTGSGYEFVGYRKDNGSPFELEMVKTDLVGDNYCTSSPLGFNLMTVTWYDQQNTNSNTANPAQNPAGNVRNTINSVDKPCYVVQTECDVDPDIKAQISDCVVWFNPIQNGTTPDADLCYSWDFGDGSPIEFGGTVMHVYPMSGTYTACLTMWCCDDPSTAVTFCETITVDCPGECELPEPGFTWECVNGGLQLTATNFGGPVDPALYCWEWENGVQNDPNLFIILPDPCPDSWGHCISMWCCDDPSTVQTVCIDFLIDCCDHPCEPLSVEEIEFTWGPSTHPSCTDGCAIGFNCPVIDADKYCVLWDFGDGNTFTDVNSCPIHCFQCSGVYDVCLTVYCCEDPSISTTVCHEVVVECCHLPNIDDFYLGLNQEDCSVDVLIDFPPTDCPNDEICYYVDFNDGTVIANTPAISHTFLTGGLKTVCLHVFCCNDPANEIVICKDIEVECDPCVLPSGMSFDYATDEDCKTVFTPLVTSDYEGDLCAEWEINGVIYPQANFLLDYCHQFTEDGVYTVCYRVYCCEDPSVFLEHCETIEINCCTIPDDFTVDHLGPTDGGCEQGFCLSNFTLDPTKYCATWDFGDGTIENHPVNVCPVHTYECDGVYLVCATVYCCDEPSKSKTSCTEITVECGNICCETPDPIGIDYFAPTPGANCQAGFCIQNTSLDPDKYCATWDFGDGTIENHPVNVCPIHVYECDGDYVVCVTVYCCEDPNIATTVCIDITVDCGHICCEEPAPFGIDYFPPTAADNCEAGFCLDNFTLDPTKYCATWDFGDGTILDFPVNVCPTHIYECDGEYVVCATVFCCEDPSISSTVCIDIVVDCGLICCETPDPIGIDYFAPTPGANCQAGFCIQNTSLDPNKYCATWDFGDGTIENHPVNVCPIHFYECDGDYVVCVTVYCCEDPSINATVCIDITVDCGNICCETPDPIGIDYFPPTAAGDCEAGFCIQNTSLDPDKYCATWDFGDGTIVNHPVNVCPVHTYECDGDYVVCVTVYCCEDPNIATTVCIDIVVDCGHICCEEPAPFGIDYFPPTAADNCEAGFCLDNFTLDPTKYCATWDFGDGTILNFPVNVCPTHIYECDGEYVVCATVFCCEDPSISSTVCIDIVVDCGLICCETPDPIGIDYFAPTPGANCQAGFCIQNTSLDPDKYCATWDFGDGTIENHPVNVCPIHFYECDGDYVVCVTVYCCEDPSINATVCIDIVVDCGNICCETPDPIGIDYFPPTAAGDCEAGFCIQNTSLDPDKYCATWDFGDGTIVNHPVNVCPVHTYECDGDYVVCVTVYCCEDPNIATTVCIDIVVDCGRTCCETPDPFEIEHFPIQGGDICGAGFCLISPTLDPSKYCSSWDFGDGTVLDFPVDVCPEHIYACDGIYDVCVTVYCCDDPSINLTQCITIEVDCPCHLPDATVVVTNINTVDECYVVVDVVTAAGDCPEDLCYSVDFGDGSPIYTGPLPVNHTYATNGSYVACVHMFCCDEPSVGVLMCQDVFVDCYTPCDVSAYFGCSENGHTVVFNDLSTAGAGTVITNWFWDFGDGNTSNLQNPTHTYLADGVYLVCLTVTGVTADGNICEDTFCVEKEIICPKPCEIYPIFLTQDLDGCTVQFLDFTYIGAYTTATGLLWDFGDGNTSTNPNPIHTFPGSGTYTVCLTVYGSSPEGDCEETFCWDVTTDCDLPCEVDADFIWDMDQCNIYFVNTSTSSSPGTTVYQWNFGDGSTGFGDNPIHTYTMSGTYIVCLTAITTMPDGTVCTDEICQTITVDCPSPCEGDPYFEWTYDNCQVQFIDLSGAPVGNNIVAWYWDFGDGSTSSLQNPLHSYTSQGSYVVCLTILVSNGNELCEFTFCRDIYVQCPTGDPCDIRSKIKAEIIGECTYQFYDASVAGAGTSIIGWHWDFGDGTTSNLQNPVHTFSGSGWRTICLTVTATNGLVECSDTRCFTKYFECPCSCESIVPTFNVTMGPNCEVYLDDTTVYPDCVDLEHIKWKFGDGHGDSGSQNTGHVYNGPGLYNICMLIITTDGNQHCEHLVCQDVYINCQGIADDQSKDLGDEFDANVYPNPSEGNITISTTGEDLNRIVVRDLSGRTVEDITNLSKANVQIDLNKEERGVYLIELFSGEQSVVKRVVIQ